MKIRIGFSGGLKMRNVPKVKVMQKVIIFEKRENNRIGFSGGFKIMNLPKVQVMQEVIIFKNESRFV